MRRELSEGAKMVSGAVVLKRDWSATVESCSKPRVERTAAIARDVWVRFSWVVDDAGGTAAVVVVEIKMAMRIIRNSKLFAIEGFVLSFGRTVEVTEEGEI